MYMLNDILKAVINGEILKQGGRKDVAYTYIDFNDFLKTLKESNHDKDVQEQLAITGITSNDITLASSLLWRLEKLLVLSDATSEDAESILGDFKVEDIIYLGNKFKALIRYLQVCIMKLYATSVNPSTRPKYLICTFIALIPTCEKHIIWTNEGTKIQCNIEEMDEVKRYTIKGLNSVSFDNQDDFILQAFAEVKTSSTTESELRKISGQFRYSNVSIIDGKEYFPIPYPTEILKKNITKGKTPILTDFLATDGIIQDDTNPGTLGFSEETEKCDEKLKF